MTYDPSDVTLGKSFQNVLAEVPEAEGDDPIFNASFLLNPAGRL